MKKSVLLIVGVLLMLFLASISFVSACVETASLPPIITDKCDTDGYVQIQTRYNCKDCCAAQNCAGKPTLAEYQGCMSTCGGSCWGCAGGGNGCDCGFEPCGIFECTSSSCVWHAENGAVILDYGACGEPPGGICTVDDDCQFKNCVNGVCGGPGGICTKDDECVSGICSGGICGGIENIRWANLLGEEISKTDLGDTVRMEVGGVALLGQAINYTIFKESFTIWNPFTWFASDAMVDTIDALSWTTIESGKFYFKAKVGGIELQSDLLIVSSTEDNALPIANITFPLDIYQAEVNSTIPFAQGSIDEDDLLRIIWDFGDGSNKSFEGYSVGADPSSANIGHNYTESDTFTIRLVAEEMTRGQSDEDFTTVAVFKEGINVHPFISDPEAGIGYGRFIDFNASQSYVAECGLNICPSGAACTFVAGNLNCYYIHASGSTSTPGYDIDVDWTFTDGIVQTLSGDWETDYNSVVEFTEFFAEAGQHVADLKLIYTP